MNDAREALVRLGGGDPFDAVLAESESHQRAHSCGLFPAGPAVMQLAAMFVRASGARTILDLGCGIGYSTFWLASAAGTRAEVTAIDSDESHIDLARVASSRLDMDRHVSFVVGEVADVLGDIEGPVDAIHDDAWFASAPPHLERMIGLLRPGGVLTMPNWFLLIDALTGEQRNNWEKYGGHTWAEDALRYAELLASRRDLKVSWTIGPPLGLAVKQA